MVMAYLFIRLIYSSHKKPKDGDVSGVIPVKSPLKAYLWRYIEFNHLVCLVVCSKRLLNNFGISLYLLDIFLSEEAITTVDSGVIPDVPS